MKLAELYNPTLEGHQHVGFIRALNNWKPLGDTAVWYASIDKLALDDYIFYNLSQRDVFEYLTQEPETAFSYIHSILKANEYKLNGLYDSTTYSDKYSPIENYDRIEDTKVVSKSDNGKRKTSTQYGAHTDTDTTEGKNSPFDDNAYGTDTDKTTTTYVNSAHNDVAESDASHDEGETKTEGRVHGNIGVATASDLLGGHRNIVNYVFFDEVIKIICNTMLSSCLWNV